MTLPIAEYLRRQGGQCNRQQPIVPVAGSELLKAATLIDELSEGLSRILPYHGTDESNADLDFARAALAKARGEA